MKLKILIGELSSYKAIVVCKFIKEVYPDVEIYTYDTYKLTKHIYTKYSNKHIILNRENIIEEITWLIKFEQIDIFFPVMNNDIKLFCKNRLLFGRSLDYFGECSHFELLNNKLKLYELSKILDIQMPKHYKSIEEAELPFVVKPTDLSSAIGVKYYKKEEDRNKFDFQGPVIIQQYIDGIGVGYSFYAKKGKILNGYGHKRLAEYPASGGPSAYREGYRDERLKQIAEKIVSYLNYTGIAMFEFKLTDDNKIYLLEVNPRIWGSIYQGIANGVNYFDGIIGESSKVKFNEKDDIKTFVSPLIYLAFIDYLISGNLKPIAVFFKNILKNKVDVSILSDPKGFISMFFHRFLFVKYEGTN